MTRPMLEPDLDGSQRVYVAPASMRIVVGAALVMAGLAAAILLWMYDNAHPARTESRATLVVVAPPEADPIDAAKMAHPVGRAVRGANARTAPSWRR